MKPVYSDHPTGQKHMVLTGGSLLREVKVYGSIIIGKWFYYRVVSPAQVTLSFRPLLLCFVWRPSVTISFRGDDWVNEAECGVGMTGELSCRDIKLVGSL